MIVNGRHPEATNTFLLEKDCSFIMYILNCIGKVYVDPEIFEVDVEDVVYVPNNSKFAVEGNFEYITIDYPAFYPEQSSEVT